MSMQEPYRVLRCAVDVSDAAISALQTRAGRAKSIFNYNTTAPLNDGLRRQQRFKNDETVAIAQFTTGVVAALRANGVVGVRHSIVEWVVLLSLAGCREQHPHTDFDPDARAGPLGVLIGLEPHTKLVVFEVVDDGGLAPHTIEFSRGDIVVFRHDTIHAGAAYDVRNIRVHCYVDYLDAPARISGKTYLMGV